MTFLTVVLILFVLSLIPLLCVAGRARFKYRGTRVVTCPETDSPAAVRVDLGRIVASSSIGEPDLRLGGCSRWPERGRCGQACLAQVHAAPAHGVVRTMLVEGHRDGWCERCGKVIGQVHWVEHEPALLTPNREMVEWDDASPEQISRVMATHQRVCWRCHLASAVRARFPGFQGAHASTSTS